MNIDTNTQPRGLKGPVLKIPSSCPFLPLSFPSPPTSAAAFLTCLRETEGASRTDKQRHTTHTTRSQWHWLQPLSVCTEEKVLELAYQKRRPIPLSQTHSFPLLLVLLSDIRAETVAAVNNFILLLPKHFQSYTLLDPQTNNTPYNSSWDCDLNWVMSWDCKWIVTAFTAGAACVAWKACSSSLPNVNATLTSSGRNTTWPQQRTSRFFFKWS